MLRRLDLTNFKAFRQFTVDFKGDAFLVGPNNAGKSTLIAALRASARMLSMATRLQPSIRLERNGSHPVGHMFSGEQVRLIEENLRHEFQPSETILRVRFDDDAYLEAVWPVEDGETPEERGGFFSVWHQGRNLLKPRDVRSAFPKIGVVPVLSPLEHREDALKDKWVRENLDGRLTSRHFRNQLRVLKSEPSDQHATRFDEFDAFAQPWLPELRLERLATSWSAEGSSVDLYYFEDDARFEKEIFWAGDGVQIWLQLLLHVFRLRDMDVLILDEPEIFLHSDLQRRLVDLLESLRGQSITATHSPEVLAEAAQETVIWVSKDRKRAVKSPGPELLLELSDTLGTQFNLRLARALRARCVLFVEGQDFKVLRHLARTVGADLLARESGVAVIPLVGFDRWEHVEPFQWMQDNFLGGSVKTFVILDRDYRADDAVADVATRLTSVGVEPRIWARHELENYLLHPRAIARLSGATQQWVREALDRIVASLEGEVYAQIQNERTQYYAAKARRSGQKTSSTTVNKEAKSRADLLWRSKGRRHEICPGKDVMNLLNERLQAHGFSTLNERKLAAEIHASEVPQEVRRVLQEINAAAS